MIEFARVVFAVLGDGLHVVPAGDRVYVSRPHSGNPQIMNFASQQYAAMGTPYACHRIPVPL